MGFRVVQDFPHQQAYETIRAADHEVQDDGIWGFPALGGSFIGVLPVRILVFGGKQGTRIHGSCHVVVGNKDADA